MVDTANFLRNRNVVMAMQEELISIVVPVYNTEKYIDDCMASILAQSYKNLQIILVDDGSTDGSGKICDAYVAKDDRFQVIHKANGGVSSALNAGIKETTGSWIMRIDPDDYVHPHMVQRLYETALQKEADLVWCAYENVPEESSYDKQSFKDTQGKLEEYTNVEAEKLFYSPQIENYIVTWNKLYRADLFKAEPALTFREGRVYEEGYIVYQLVYRAKKVVVLSEEPLYFYRQRGNGIMDKNGHKIYLPVLESGEERIAFYKEKGEKELYRLEINMMMNSSISLYQDMTDASSRKEVKQWFRKFYKNYFQKEKWPMSKKIGMRAFLMGNGLYKLLKKIGG